jgi:IS30 family transposase
MNVSHETIYQSLFIQARGLFKAELVACLRSGRQLRGTGTRNAVPQRGKIPDGVSIRQRPAEVEDRAVPGHWEGDLLAGGRRSFIATLVERTTRFAMLVKVENKETDTVIDALIRQARKLPDELRRSLTWDRGHEMFQHKRFTLATDMNVYFCDPQSPWQRGSNENTNRLLRQYFPKGFDLSAVTQAELNRVARELNGRPRETLGWKSPAEALDLAMQ